ncbi:MAG: M23 family metallopeptidase [Candidatus Dormibacteraeota bacterium]|nr:M23 family metallopeptidase [Candidatus Dormibacteraeota bacterium]
MLRSVAAGTAAVITLLAAGTAGAGAALSPALQSGFAKPVLGAHISQGFGCTDVAIEPRDPACPGGHWHSGIDLAAPYGTPVHATLGGVVQVIVSPFGYGLHIIIDHGNGLTSLYGHLSEVNISTGQLVTTGQVIGAVGTSGNSTGPHLHFEIRRDGIAENPLLDLALP